MPANPSPAKARRRAAGRPRRAYAGSPAPAAEASVPGASPAAPAFAAPPQSPPPVFPPVPYPTPAEPRPLPEPHGAWRALGFLLSLCQPWAGLVLALLYWPSADGRSRRFSRWCLALALIGLVLGALTVAAWTAAQSGESGIQPW